MTDERAHARAAGGGGVALPRDAGAPRAITVWLVTGVGVVLATLGILLIAIAPSGQGSFEQQLQASRGQAVSPEAAGGG